MKTSAERPNLNHIAHLESHFWISNQGANPNFPDIRQFQWALFLT